VGTEQWLAMDIAERQAYLAHVDPSAIGIVTTPNRWGVFASIGQRFQYVIFGRDSIETAEDILHTNRGLAQDVITTLARLQGTKTDHTSEEEPGKIHHEYRCLRIHDTPEYRQYLIELQEVWGGKGTDRMTYYGSHDATPLYVRLVGRFVQQYGPEILDQTVKNKDDQEVTVRGSILSALQWLTGKIDAHPLGLFGYQRLNPVGLTNQCWKDSRTSHLRSDGSLPNFDAPVVSIEMQGYAYDALLAGIDLGLGDDTQQQYWHSLARRLQLHTLKYLWMDQHQYFAQGLDIDAQGNPRLLDTITSDPAALLDSNLIHGLPTHAARHLSERIAQVALGPELLTDIGIRCRALKHWDLVDYADYHGPATVWPKETYDIAKGLRRAGLTAQAKDLETRMLRSLRRAGEFYEFFYVHHDGTVWYDHNQAIQHFRAESPNHPDYPVPEPGQAWTIAAAISASTIAGL
jgi:glycogen debranching enzyme